MKKRGLSNIVATILIVLLALAAAGLVWGFVKSFLVDSGTSIDLRAQCLDVDVGVVSCVYSAGTDNASVVVKQEMGDVSEVIAIINLLDGTAFTTQTSAPGQFGTKEITVDAGSQNDDNNATIAMVSAVISDDAGNSEACPPSPSVRCSSVV
ncbi:MAG: hypothetical protein KJ600_06975 [Nanoarchaeota archaeon]|nr:hypothetical protein [Nanoarchaeota archaeon]